MVRSPSPGLVLLDGADVIDLEPHRPIRRLGTDGVWRRLACDGATLWVVHGEGPGARRERLGTGDVVHLGRRVLLVASRSGSRRFPDAIVWRGLLARSSRSLLALGRLGAAASSAAPVWLWGESGTGKELAARALHDAGPRASAPFVAVNCASLPETLAESELFGVRRGAYTGADRDRPGAFVSADGGTLLLDEVGELPMSTQAKLLRVLETGQVPALGATVPRRVDVRIVAATWRDLDRAAEAGRFRFDLLQRLGVLRVTLPPLRQRPTDIGPLLESALVSFEADDLWPEAALLAAIECAPWHGNVRELRSAAQRAAVWGDPRALVPHRSRLGPRPAPTSPSSRHDRPAVARTALRHTGGNRAAAARSLGVSRSTFYRWLVPTHEALQSLRGHRAG